MIEGIGQDQTIGDQLGDGRDARLIGDIARGEDQRRLLAVEIGKLSLKLDQRMIGAGDVARAARPGAKPGGGFNTSGYISNQASISDKGTERLRITPTPS
jgi:hypothetical protein